MSAISALYFTTSDEFKAAYFNQLNQNGFAILRNAMPCEITEQIKSLIENADLNHSQYQKKNQLFAARNLLIAIPELIPLLESIPIHALTEPILGSGAKFIKAIYFNKPQSANWKVPWHQDLTIAVQAKIETEGFEAWTVKENVPNVQPPVSLLEKILTLRIHLDQTDEHNGALRVIPQSHRQGKLGKTEIEHALQENQPVTCCVQAGDVIAMRPLLLHASSTSVQPSQRRVLHLEFCAETLPDKLNWHGT